MNEMPPGFRFYPTEEELISFYLEKKLESCTTPDLSSVIPLLHIYDFNPWDLPQYAGQLCHGDPEQWFFFNPRPEKEARGGRPNRLTTAGYWKATGSPSNVYSKDSRLIGLKRTMVFYKGRAPEGEKTEWKMNEYRAIQLQDQLQFAPSSSTSINPQFRQEMSLCRVYTRSKCMRSFDRRPSAGIPVESTTNEAHGTTTMPLNHNHDYQVNHNQESTLMMSLVTSSADHSNSSSGGEAVMTEAAEDSAVVNSIDTETVWNLHKVDWFLNNTD